MVRWDTENKSSNTTQLEIGERDKWNGWLHAMSRELIKPGERRATFWRDTPQKISSWKWTKELKGRVVIIWCSKTEQTGGREKMPLAEKKKVQPKEMVVIWSISLARNIQAQSYFWKALEKTYDLSLWILFAMGGLRKVRKVGMLASKRILRTLQQDN